MLLRNATFHRLAMRPTQVFISYRRDDTAGYARAICEELGRHFGASRVFIDVDDIRAGQPFSEVIEHEVDASQVLLVLIGRRWLGEQAGAPPRLGEPGDFVRREVAAGLANGARVIPVLLDGAPMPTESQLPDELRALAGRNALEIDNSRYAADMSRLVAVLRHALGAAEATAPAPLPIARVGRRRALAWVGAALVVGALAAGWVSRRTAGRSPGEHAAAVDRAASDLAATTRPAVNGLWQAEVRYDWSNAPHVESFDFRGDASGLHGSASFLGVPRGVLEGRVEPAGLQFITRTTEVAAGASRDLVHRYRGRWVGGELRIVMQTEGGSSPLAPVEFVARRLTPAAAAASR
jgi:hypothetical protein